MQTYQCHKRVKAAQITEVIMNTVPSTLGGYGVTRIAAGEFTVNGDAATKMSVRYVPKLDDYLVEYDDGHLSVSPKKAFEDGYTLVEECAA